ncbi:dihydropteroate synthase [Solitalea longa]|uniref:Dihydropteroate synthase n=1 Tax=Solitalea longa TaxID=2079460 RepID=A0A2S5AAF2_9SPHI|nr:dihydropteroate synthase [Solitalea longa]POY39362.1 dihydropteroate synthase [Solitalea longa]
MHKHTFFNNRTTLNCNGRLLNLSTPKVMGILNITPDSFFDGGKYTSVNDSLHRCEQLLTDGADIIDLGAYSSRPGAADVAEVEEIGRIVPVLQAILKQFPQAILSIDTFRSEVAKVAVNEGASIINDISGGELDSKMFETAAQLQVPYILMHMRGTPDTMQKLTDYDDLLSEMVRYFVEKVHRLRSLGLNDIVLDPGFGFAKTIEQNYKLLGHLSEFKIFDLPLLSGISRKSMIYKLLETDASQALNGTSVLNMVSLQNGANILRVHDVKEAVEVRKIFSMLNNSY